MLRLISANLNGIRSAATKGFFDWLATQPVTALGVQEVKAQAEQVEGLFCTAHNLHGQTLRGHFHYAQKKGYSGVGLYTSVEPSDVRIGMGTPEFDDEGRWVEARFDRPGRKLSLISSYFPSGSSSEERQQAKFRFLNAIEPVLRSLAEQREFILVGDINIAHQEIDLKNWKGNLKNSGFLPEERNWLSRLFTSPGLVDVYRRLEPTATDAAYTWWSNRGQARAKNVGWRIDYQIATPGVAALAQAVSIYTDQRFSDHAPVVVDYKLDLAA
jgi:exodeoxyribonuclease-3